MVEDGVGRLLSLLGADPSDPQERLGVTLAEADNRLIDDLVALRKAKGLLQRDVAARMGRDQAAVSNFERLGADPHLSTVRRYARAVGAEVVHHVTDAVPESPPATEGLGVIGDFRQATVSATREFRVGFS